jgi:hypothetical protein
LEDGLIFDTAMLKKRGEASALTVLFEDEYFVAMDFNAIVLDDVWVLEDFHDAQLIFDLLEQGR